MGYFDWNNNGRLDSIDTALELMMLEKIQKEQGISDNTFIGGKFVATAAVVGAFLWILSFFG